MPFDVQMPDGTVIQGVPDGTTKAQIQAKYASHLGKAAQSDAQVTLAGLGKAALSGLGQGVAGLGGVIDTISGAQGLNSALADAAAKQHVQMPWMPTAQNILNAAFSAPTGGYHTPQNDAEHAAQTVGSFLPGLVMGPEGALAKTASVALPAAGSEIGYQAAKGTPYEGLAQVAGGILGGGLSGLRMRAPQMPNLLGDVSPETKDLYQKMQALGVNVRPAQTAQPGFAKTADDVLQRLPFTGYGSASLPNDEMQARQFTQALSKMIGVDSPVLTEDVMSKAYKQIGDIYDRVLPRNSITGDAQTANGINQISTKLADVAPALEKPQVDRIASVINRVTDTLNNGPMEGKVYQAMRQRNGLLDTLANDQNSTIASFGQGLKDVLDNAFERQAPPHDAQDLLLARQRYRIAKTIDPVVAKAPTGVISPPLLAGVVRKEYPNMTTGEAGDLGTLARGGQAFLRAPPNSLTADRNVIIQGLRHPATMAAGGAGLGTLVGGTGGGLGALPMMLFGARTLKNAVNSNAARRALAGTAQKPPLLGYTPNLYPLLLAPSEAQQQGQ